MSAATGVAVAKGRPDRRGEQVELSGWLASASVGARHYYVLGASPFVTDPAAADHAHWPDHLTMVLPADVATMRPGRVNLKGRLYRGRFRDESTGRASKAVLVGARLA